MTLRLWTTPCLACTALIVLGASGLTAREIHVAKTGSDTASGDRSSPYITINKAASVAQPGDVVIVHEGIYREWVKPVRGGTGEEKRITYRAAPGEKVVVKGSERITSWVHEANDVWKVELQNRFFGDYNPYALNVSGGWLNYGQWHHRGDVYLNGEAFFERETVETVRKQKRSWCCKADGQITTIWANFGEADPNEELAEINVRESVFMPEKVGLSYITVDGFHLAHSAENWQPPRLKTQMGMIGPRGGKRWIIENCTITNARCVGIILGHAQGTDYSDIDAYGDHVIRNNVILRCGQAGIAGQQGATRSVISGNFIEDTNYRKEFGGWETAAIKFHASTDTVISGNLIRGVYRKKSGAFGIWIDWGNQGTRITGNIIYKTQMATIYLEMNHGAQLVDNNVLIGTRVRNFGSEGIVYAHNLFVDSGYMVGKDMNRQSEYYEPHSKKLAGRKHGIPQDELWYNNIYIRAGLNGLKEAKGYKSDYNVFLEGAKKSSFADKDSVVDRFVTEFKREDRPLGVSIRFSMNDAASRVRAPLVDSKLVGVLATVGQTIEDRDGNPITIDTDMNGKRFSRPIPGPLANLQRGENVITWSMRKQ